MKAIFVGGCGRSGSTLLGAMLGAHSKCIATPESQFKLPLLALFRRNRGEEIDWQSIETLLTGHARLGHWGIDISAVVERHSHNSPTYSELLASIVDQYAATQGRRTFEFWVDHTGRQNAAYGPTLLQECDDSCFIHLIRDGRGVAASVLQLDWGPNTIERAAPWWMEHIAFGLASEVYLGARATRVYFEDLVTQPQTTLERLCSFLDLDFEPGMLLANGLAIPAYTRNQHQLVGTPPDEKRCDLWKERLSPRQIETFEALTADLLPALGYALQSDVRRGVMRHERIRSLIVEFIRGGVINRFRRRHRTRAHHGHEARHADQGRVLDPT